MVVNPANYRTVCVQNYQPNLATVCMWPMFHLRKQIGENTAALYLGTGLFARDRHI